MKVDLLYWNKVTVMCPSDQSKSLTLGRCFVDFNGDRVCVRERDPAPGCAPKDVVYGRAVCAGVDRTSARFRAHWFGSDFSTGKDVFVPVEIECEF